MPTVDPVKVTGLREFQAALKAIDGESQKLLRVVLNEAAEVVAVEARRRMPRRSGRAEGSVRARSSQREAIVMGGSKKVPYVGWLEFGGRIGRDKSVKRPYRAEGRYIYPAIANQRAEITRALSEGLVRVARSAGLDAEVTGGD